MTAPEAPLLLLTRPAAQSERFAARAGASCPPFRLLIAPLNKIVALPFDAAALQGAEVIFTSANAVAAVAGIARPGGQRAWCVGPATAAAARAAGFSVREAGGDAVHLLADLRRARPDAPLVHVRGRHVACDLAGSLARDGKTVGQVIAYEARACAWDAGVMATLEGAGQIVAPLFSPRAAAAFSARIGQPPPGLQVIAISAACAARLSPALRRDAAIAERPDGDAMLRATSDALARSGASLEAGRRGG
ncbi:uroporphyrinogen-III synthase [Pararhodobacter sp. SW119]|uniref:uroporphyrinogen-III synthase n=1 Tax=Pararhodobacter sp. SW119 TaxID=2780075 RepID=UPI001ADF9AA5|nr:uroporphyrinogen-III synthase [Pararhodobacter sp. SW119]